ncbi:ribosome silencing factor [Hassallia byssoidea VB512170]|uniref:Ribosomal silencing factor RsfS n=1 Tax=Hassallia byssoidea VB512170 TaxID=1304833 RepID=A0A846HCV6_9CYAN|nr:ribosome silencing factor [Hassalia byssoidea]NEU74609.1 ribosome silencing factor [Hassalia byssoidea VB512170]
MSDFQGIPLQSVFLSEKALLSSSTDSDQMSRKLAETIVVAASDRKAGDIVLLHVAEVSYLADYFVMMTGYSRVQVRAIADAIEEKVFTELQRNPLRTAGKAEGNWVLQDYGDIIVHVMMPKEREFYNLEAFWGHAERIEYPKPDEGGGKPT